MPDIIQLLPDSVANQIAAGEVIQRPASVVKELLENSVDSGADEIKLVIKDAGRTLIQVIDNGCGMSDTDARLCFERHATSKIKKAKDLFNIKTMGFRGEALASVAAITYLQLKTKKTEEELGTCVTIEGGNVKSQESVICPNGTSISVKNIFFNVPARRNFLKSNFVEIKHIIEEFQRIALAYPKISFLMFNNDNETYNLLKNSGLKQRISAIFSKNYNQRLIPVEQETHFIKISGFIGKPEFAKKTRGEQYFFVNNRFIKHPYLNHAVNHAFEELLPSSAFPSYFIFFDVDPKTIDINIHPTKTEIKFQDDKIVYAVLQSTVKKALAKFNITPSIDFDVENSFDIPYSERNKPIRPPQIKINHDYNPFDNPRAIPFYKLQTPLEKSNKENWTKLFTSDTQDTSKLLNNLPEANKNILQIDNRYILTNIKSGLMIIDQQRAHERILYEHFIDILENKITASQQQLFPQTIEFSASDAQLIKEIKNDIETLGFKIDNSGLNSFVINGIPADISKIDVKELLETVLENYKRNLTDINLDKKTNLAQSMAKNISVKSGRTLKKEEMNALTDKLFACKIPYSSISGNPTFVIITFDEIEKKFKSY